MDQDKSTQHVIVSTIGKIGCITLNRTNALNALTLDMIRDIRFTLDKWLEDDAIHAIYIDGNGERAFCAGGDIKHFYRAGMDFRRGNISLDTALVFFKEEYALNNLIFSYPKPIIAHMHGITMGGGFGVAGNARYRIVSQDTIFAMPEVKIGFFPDIGSMYHLTRIKNNFVGMYLALSGNTILSGDMLKFGLSEYAFEKNRKDDVIASLNEALDSSNEDIHDLTHQVLLAHTNDSALKYTLSDDMLNDIDSALSNYDPSNVLNIFDGSDSLRDIAKTMKKNSPFAMVFACEYFEYSKNKPFSNVIENDLVVCSNFTGDSDFYEGIRAAVIDKDKMPIWSQHQAVSDLQSIAKKYLPELK